MANRNEQGTPPPRRNLPIIERLTSTYGLWHQLLPHVPKTVRYTLGGKVDRAFVETLELVFIASYLSRGEKAPYLRRAILKLDVLKFFLHITWQVKAIDTKKYGVLSEPLDEIGRMLGGWYRQVVPKETPPT